MTVSSPAPLLVSALVPAYNAENTLRACLDALSAQNFPKGQYEVIAVDNGSNDRTWPIIQRYGSKVRALQETQIQGSYAARNTGIKASHGSIVALTDADCVPDRHWLRELIQPFNDPLVGCVVGEITAYPPTTAVQTFAAQVKLLSQRHTLNNLFHPYGQTANVAYRRQVFGQIGFFDESMESGGDADFCWRMQAETGWQLKFNERASVMHQHRADWQGLWRQFQRYGRGNAALRVRYPASGGGTFGTPRRCLWLCAQLAARLARYPVYCSLSAESRRPIQEALLENLYRLTMNAAFMLGRMQAKRRQ